MSTHADAVICESGHRYPLVEGVPIMLVKELPPTHWVATLALQTAAAQNHSAGVHDAREGESNDNGIDPYVQAAIGGTNGIMYGRLTSKLTEYPIPIFRGTQGAGGHLLDIGCAWGRWSVAAARWGYKPVGIDPSLDAVLAARRVARQLGAEAAFLVADARCLPFCAARFDAVFSYSVLQHFAKEDVVRSLSEIRRLLAPGGYSLIQMPNRFGLRCIWHQARRKFREPKDFEVRYWSPRELRAVFEELIGPTRLSVDGFFSLNAQASDLHMLPFRYRCVVRCSEALRGITPYARSLLQVADSLYLESRKVE